MNEPVTKHTSNGDDALQYTQYDPSSENVYLPIIRELISKDLSEPYSIYVYRYFLYQWGDLCYMVRRPNDFIACIHVAALLTVDFVYQAKDQADNLIGVVVCKLEPHRGGPLRGYIAMLAVEKEHRGKGIATKLVCLAIDAMITKGADEVCRPCSLRSKITDIVIRSHWRRRLTTWPL